MFYVRYTLRQSVVIVVETFFFSAKYKIGIDELQSMEHVRGHRTARGEQFKKYN
jgi:hypothetical protein